LGGYVRNRTEQREAAALAVHGVLPRGEGHVATVAAATLPDAEADQLEADERTIAKVQLGIGELSRRVALVVRRDLDREFRGGRACRSHLVLQRNREVVVPSQPEEPHQHGAERTRGRRWRTRRQTNVARRDRLFCAWRER